ncbi:MULTISPECIES: GNAT family N-acetyltransferase [unclassified Haloparvum]|uniref:GNAT family N-acetyltransferase n=1 Tax=Haloparvum sp. PAK95 TaxID=3418962 RepID=UPI003D2EC004
MTPERFPDAVAGTFEPPPVEFEDREGRPIEVRAYDGTDAEHDALARMYDDFDPADRAQGIPPSRPEKVREWLESILGGDCFNVIAWHGDEVAGHATLVPDEDAYELAIFVHQEYQEAGIGTRLIKALLGYGQQEDIEKVWLTVERWNRAAVALYKKIGFETTNAESFELEMALRLNEDGE